MRVSVTGATGWVGSAVVKELVDAGHQVTGLVRSDEKATALAAGVLRGTLDHLDALRNAASAADAVIHTAFSPNFSKFVEGCEQDRRALACHGVADEGVPFRDIAEVIGRRLDLPVEPRGREHFGWFADFAGLDMPASSAHTQSLLGWQPTGLELLADIDQPGYYLT